MSVDLTNEELEDYVRVLLENNQRLTDAVNAAPEFERTMKLAMMTSEGLVEWMRVMTDGEREAVFVALRNAFCQHCGCDDPGCQCDNDE